VDGDVAAAVTGAIGEPAVVLAHLFLFALRVCGFGVRGGEGGPAGEGLVDVVCFDVLWVFVCEGAGNK
jgi:hypothetical protein